MKYGIDISHWNLIQNATDLVDTKTNHKIEFVIMKISQRKSKDASFEKNYEKLKDKYLVGGYIYSKVKNPQEAMDEANFAVQCLQGKKMPAWVWLDMEDSSMRKLGKATLSNIIRTEAKILRTAGYNVGIYCNKDWYSNVLDAALRKDFKFWIARYPSADNGTIKENLSPKGYAAIWQYSSKGRVKGMGIGNVDMDILYENIFETTTPAPAPTPTPTTTKKNPWPVPTRTLYKGCTKGDDVKWLQFELNEMGYKLTIDGIIGTLTDTAIRSAQKKLGLAVDGKCGPKTREALIKN